jgi:imidazolonepropionase-like amidohydrolase
MASPLCAPLVIRRRTSCSCAISHPPFNIAVEPVPEEVSRLATMLGQKHVAVTTTVSVFDAYGAPSSGQRSSTGATYTNATRKEPFDRLMRIIPILAEAGVTLVTGTDWVDRLVNIDDEHLMPGAKTLHEMDLLRRAGLSTQAVIDSATRNGADALGVPKNVGTIAEGKLADLVIIDGDLLDDFSALHRTIAVFIEHA